MFKRIWEQAKDTIFEKFCWKEGQKNAVKAGGKGEERMFFQM